MSTMQKTIRQVNTYARFSCPLCKAIGTLCIIKDQNMLVYPPGRLVQCCNCNATVLVTKQSIGLIDSH